MVEDATIQRQIGLMGVKLKVLWQALLGALDELGDEYVTDDRSMAPLMIAKRQIVTEAQEIVDLAIQVVGASSYLAPSFLERACRDVRAGAFHPLNPERTLAPVGRFPLGIPADTIW